VRPIEHNNASFVEQLNWHTNQTTAALSRLSSGSKLLAPQDDAAGLAVATRMEAANRQLAATQNNLANAISYSQTQNGYLAGAQSVLDRMGELAIRAQDGTLSEDQRTLYAQEFHALKDVFNDARTARYNEANLFDGHQLQVPLSPESGSVGAGSVDLFTPELNALTANETALDTTTAAQNAMAIITEAGEHVANALARVGTSLNGLAMAQEQIATQRANLAESVSHIQDTDVAATVTDLAKQRLMAENSVFALNQANLQGGQFINLLS
jgi:flagellin